MPRDRPRVTLVSVAIGSRYEPRVRQMHAALGETAGIDELQLWTRTDIQDDALFREHSRTVEWMERAYGSRYRARPFCAWFKPLALWRALERAREGDIVLWADANKYDDETRPLSLSPHVHVCIRVQLSTRMVHELP